MINEEQAFDEIINHPSYKEEYCMWDEHFINMTFTMDSDYDEDGKYNDVWSYRQIEVLLNLDGIAEVSFIVKDGLFVEGEGFESDNTQVDYNHEELDEFLKTPAGEKLRNHVKHVLVRNI